MRKRTRTSVLSESATDSPCPNYATQSSSSDIIRFLISTDSHLGHRERDSVRSEDSFLALEETLRLAKALEVDCVLHCGDLFDHHKPSRATLHKTLRLLRELCLDQQSDSLENRAASQSQVKAITFSILNTQNTRRKVLKQGNANFEQSAFSVSLPIFAIHGNHDDPGGDEFLSAMDILDASGLVNYIGWTPDLDKITMTPLLLEKGLTKIALYSLGNIRDERLHRAFTNGKVTIEPPEVGSSEEYFNMMMIHQNRYKGDFGGTINKNCIHEEMLPKNLDLVIWGHEHDCIPVCVESLKAEFHVVQPGSSIATALSEGEALPKHVVLIEVKGDSFRSTFVPLKLVRPFQCGDFTVLPSMPHDTLINQLAKEVEKLVENGNTQWDQNQSQWKTYLLQKIAPALGKSILSKGISGHDNDVAGGQNGEDKLSQFLSWSDEKAKTWCSGPPLPLVRLRVTSASYLSSGTELPSAQIFGAQFLDRVANPEDILLFTKKRSKSVSSNLVGNEEDEFNELQNQPSQIHETISSLVHREIKLEVLPEMDFHEAVQNFVQKSESSAIQRFVDSTITLVGNDLKKNVDTNDNAETFKTALYSRTAYLREQRLAKTTEMDAPSEISNLPPFLSDDVERDPINSLFEPDESPTLNPKSQPAPISLPTFKSLPTKTTPAPPAPTSQALLAPAPTSQALLAPAPTSQALLAPALLGRRGQKRVNSPKNRSVNPKKTKKDSPPKPNASPTVSSSQQSSTKTRPTSSILAHLKQTKSEIISSNVLTPDENSLTQTDFDDILNSLTF